MGHPEEVLRSNKRRDADYLLTYTVKINKIQRQLIGRRRKMYFSQFENYIFWALEPHLFQVEGIC